MENHGILLLHCPDQLGIVSKVTTFLLSRKGNILDIDQHVDKRNKHFYMRLEWDLDACAVSLSELQSQFSLFAKQEFEELHWEIRRADKKLRMAVFVSKLSHCLYDILQRVHDGSWKIDIPCIISNHENLRSVAERFDIPYYHMPVSAQTKEQQEARQLELLAKHRIDVIALARYMQILSPRFVDHYPSSIINIHHSFLPAFPGARPYHSAHKRGVKIIGATSHFVTSELDGGPIIAQDVVHVSHHDDVKDLVRKGADLEKIVLARALWSFFQHKLLVHNQRTIVFQ